MTASTQGKKGQRIALFDTVRGMTVISMVAFHVTYDLVYLYGCNIPLFTQGPFQEIWRSSISWTFLLLAGWMTRLSRNNWRRAGVYALAAFTVYVATSLVAVDTPVSFGIIFCMAASTALFQLLKDLVDRFPATVGAVAFLALFFLTQQVPKGIYEIPYLAWLGFPTAGFASGDYYPVLPFSFMYLAGSCIGRTFEERLQAGYPAWMKSDYCPPLSWVGRKSLIIYLIHQPIAILILMLIFGY